MNATPLTPELYMDLFNRHQALQATVEALRRERDEANKRAEQCRRDRAMVLNVKTTDGLTASDWLMRTAVARQKAKDLQAALDAERIRREQVEMANYAKDGQIETLQANITQLKDWRDQVTLALKREGGARFEDVPGYVRAMAKELTQLQARAERVYLDMADQPLAYGLKSHNVSILTAALQQTRKDALREAAQLYKDWVAGKWFDEMEFQAALDRLASEEG